MVRYYLFILLLMPITVWAENQVTDVIKDSVADIQAAIEGINESYKQCEALYEEVRNSECANSVFGILGRMHLKLGVSFTERQLKFQNSKSEEDAFVLSSGSKPRPIYGIALSDSYFDGSNWGYGFGFDYFDDYAFEQVIQRGSSSTKESFDLGTYSSMSVISVSPSIFYTWGRNDNTPNTYGKLGLGVNVMHSSVRGTAYETELNTPENSACYDTASHVLNENANPLSIEGACELQRFKERSYGTGSRIFVIGGWKKWEGEFSISQYQHRGNGDYRFVTQQILIGLSRKFSF